MNKITKYLTTGAAAMLILMSVGATQNNVSAKRHYHVRVSRYAKKYGKKNVRHNHKSRRSAKTNKVNRLKKRNKQAVKNATRHYQKKHKKSTRHSKRTVKRYAKRLNKRRKNRYAYTQVLKSHYRLVSTNKRGKKLLNKSGFFDGRILAKIGYDPSFAQYVFSKYAPNDKRAVVPSYMNPKSQKLLRKDPNYNNVNKDLWVQGYFSLNHPKADPHHKVYKYYPKLHGWKLDPMHESFNN